MEDRKSIFAGSLERLVDTLHVPSLREIHQHNANLEKMTVHLRSVCDDPETATRCINLVRKRGGDAWRGIAALIQICQRGAATREDVLQIIATAPELIKEPSLTLHKSRMGWIKWAEFKRHLSV